MKTILLSFISFFITIIITSQNISVVSFASGFSNAVGIENAGDNRLFVVEKDGLIKVVNADGTVNATPFLNIDPIVSDSGGERGLLGLAFHPNYSTNGFYYVNYINDAGDTVISRFTVDSTNPSDAGYNTSDPNSELILLSFSQPFSNHNGGDIAFGADNYLYIASGDGGSGGDPGDRAQALNTLLGKMLRIDVDNPSNGNNYGIPTDNPFFNDGNTNTLPEIWAYGLRNPWRFSFDRQTNDLWIADVGQNNYEEINRVLLTDDEVNYGWRCYEGNNVFNDSGNCPSDTSGLTFPVAQYFHSSGRCSITGGFRYRGTQQMSLVGVYFFADYCTGEIGKLTENVSGGWDVVYDDVLTNNWTSFGEDANGELYIVAQNSSSLFKINENNLSTNEFEDQLNLKLYPNPTTIGGITLSFSNLSANISEINIYTIQGELVFTQKSVNENILNISTSQFSSGLYIVEVRDIENNNSRKKLIIN